MALIPKAIFLEVQLLIMFPYRFAEHSIITRSSIWVKVRDRSDVVTRKPALFTVESTLLPVALTELPHKSFATTKLFSINKPFLPAPSASLQAAISTLSHLPTFLFGNFTMPCAAAITMFTTSDVGIFVMLMLTFFAGTLVVYVVATRWTLLRSEERRVGKECRSRLSAAH